MHQQPLRISRNCCLNYWRRFLTPRDAIRSWFLLKKAIALDLLQVLADYVTLTAKGDRTLILQSGFDVTSENSSSNDLPSIEMLEVEVGQSGEATTRAKNVTGVK